MRRPIYIYKNKSSLLNREIDIHRIFWEIPVIEYWKQKEGVIKKQMKIVSKTQTNMKI